MSKSVSPLPVQEALTRYKTSQFKGNPTAFVVISPHCSGCVRILESIAAGEHALGNSNLHTVLVSTADIPETLELTQRFSLPADLTLLVDTQEHLAKNWGVNTTPIVIEVDADFKLSRQTVFAGAQA